MLERAKEREMKPYDVVDELEGIMGSQNPAEIEVHGRWPMDQGFQCLLGGAVCFARKAFHAVLVALGNT
jgi:hypothetical protein